MTTVEGLAKGAALHPVQAAFIEHDGFQCGFCTSGQVMSGVAAIADHRPPMPRERLSPPGAKRFRRKFRLRRELTARADDRIGLITELSKVCFRKRSQLAWAGPRNSRCGSMLMPGPADD